MMGLYWQRGKTQHQVQKNAVSVLVQGSVAKCTAAQLTRAGMSGQLVRVKRSFQNPRLLHICTIVQRPPRDPECDSQPPSMSGDVTKLAYLSTGELQHFLYKRPPIL